MKRFLQFFIISFLSQAAFASAPSVNANANASAASAPAAAPSAAVDQKSGEECKSGAESKKGSENPAIINLEMIQMVAFHPSGRFSAVVTISNGIRIYSIDQNTGVFTQVPGSPFQDRHVRKIIFHPNGRYAMTSGEGKINIFSINDKTGALQLVETLNRNDEKLVYSKTGKFAASITKISRLNTINLYTVQQDGRIVPTTDSPYTIEKPLLELDFFDDNFLAVLTNDNVITIYKINEEGKIAQLSQKTIDLALSKPTPNIFRASADTKHLFVGTTYDQELFIFEFDSQKLTLLSDIPLLHNMNDIFFDPQDKFYAMTYGARQNTVKVQLFRILDAWNIQRRGILAYTFKDKNPKNIIFSPDGSIALAHSVYGNTINIFEVNQETGVFTPITGQPLKLVLAQKEQEAMLEAFHTFAPGLVQQAVPRHTLASYVRNQPTTKTPATTLDQKKEVERQKADAKQTAEEEKQEKELKEKIDKTQKQRESQQNDAQRLFAAIAKDDVDEVKQFLTPFTINARGKESQTPLIAAINGNNLKIINELMNYEGLIQDTQYHQTTVPTDLAAVNDAGNTALMLAIIIENLSLALKLAQKMKPDDLKKKNNGGNTAFDLAQKHITDKDSADYKQLLALIKP